MELNSFMSAGVVVIVVAVLFMAWSIWRTGNRPESLGDWAVQAEAAEKWAQLAVAAAQQLMESGQIEAGQRFEHADAFLLETLPNLDESQRRLLIEASVFWLHRLRHLRPPLGAGEM